MNSWRSSSHFCPVLVRKSIAFSHSGIVSSTSRANACRCRTSAVRISRSLGSVCAPKLSMTASAAVSSVKSVAMAPRLRPRSGAGLPPVAVRFSVRTAAGFTPRAARSAPAPTSTPASGIFQIGSRRRSSADQADGPDSLIAARAEILIRRRAALNIRNASGSSMNTAEATLPQMSRVPGSRITSNQASQHSSVAVISRKAIAIWRPRQSAQPVAANAEQLDDVEPDPGAAPVVGVEGAVQGEREHDDPRGQGGAGDDREQRRRPGGGGRRTGQAWDPGSRRRPACEPAGAGRPRSCRADLTL